MRYTYKADRNFEQRFFDELVDKFRGIKSKTSSDARQSPLELANSKFVPLLPDIESLIRKPFPSSKFFLTLSLGSGGFFLASPVLKKPSLAHELSVKNIRKSMIKFLFLGNLDILSF